jgi:Delta7-sterol 5-desaturase
MKGALILATSALLAAPQVQAQAGATGEWWTPGFNARVRIEPCADALCGRIVWLWDEAPKGVADKAPLVGRLVIDRMRAAEAGFWRGGRLYNPEDGRDYKGSLQLQSPDRLVVDGCVLFICQTQVWRRAEPGRCPPVAPASPSIAR